MSVGAALGADLRWALLVAVLFAITWIRQIRRPTEVTLGEPPAGAEIQSAGRTAAEAAALGLSVFGLVWLAAVVLAWVGLRFVLGWPATYALFAGATVPAALAAEYLSSAVSAGRMERKHQILELHPWRPRIPGGGDLYAVAADARKGGAASA